MSKFRQKYGQFIVEGRKSVHELIHSNYNVETILATPGFIKRHEWTHPVEPISEAEYARLSAFDTPPGILAVAGIKEFSLDEFDWQAPISLALDQVMDPGNLGTMVRTADWYGIDQLILSHGCTDFYNPKALAATMGSFTRCKFVYTDLPQFLKGKNTMGCFLEGSNVHNIKMQFPCILVVGSESHGISAEVEKVIAQKITIPGSGRAESLNASVAAAVALDNLYRLLHR